MATIATFTVPQPSVPNTTCAVVEVPGGFRVVLGGVTVTETADAGEALAIALNEAGLLRMVLVEGRNWQV